MQSLIHKIFLVFIFCSIISFAQTDSYSVGGYAKYLFSSVKYPQFSERYYDHLLHERLNTKWYASNNLTATMELRFRALAGGSVKNYPSYSEAIKTYQPLMDLDVFLWNNK